MQRDEYKVPASMLSPAVIPSVSGSMTRASWNRSRTTLVKNEPWRDVVEAVSSGQFFIYAVGAIEEAIELLTGLPAGDRGLDGPVPSDTVYGRAARRLAEAVAEWGEREVKFQDIPESGNIRAG